MPIAVAASFTRKGIGFDYGAAMDLCCAYYLCIILTDSGPQTSHHGQETRLKVDASKQTVGTSRGT